MNGSNFSNFEKEFNLKEMNIQDNSSQNTVEFNPNPNYNKNENNVSSEYENENVLLNDKPILNINTLQSIRISHSIENSKNSQSLIDILNENKLINLNNEKEENNENDVNINNRPNKKIKKEIKNINKDNNENISRNLNMKTFNSNHTNTNNKIKNKDIYDKFKIGDIFKERFEEKTKNNKLIYNKGNKISKKFNNNYNNKNNQENKPKTLEYQNKNKNKNFISNIKNNIHNEFIQLKENDSIIIEPDSIEMNNSKNNKLILETFNMQDSSEKDDKNIMVSELDIDVSNSIQNDKNNDNDNEIKIKNMKLEKAVDYIGPKKNTQDGNHNHIQKKLSEKNKLIKKKIYPIRKINLNENIHKRNIIQLKKRSEKEKTNSKYKNSQSTSSTKLPKGKNHNNLYLKQALNNSNIIPNNNHILNTSANINKQSINKKSIYTVSRQFSYKPKYSSKSIRTEKSINLKKYYRINSNNKNRNENNDLYNNIKNIIMNSLNNRNNLNKALNITTLNSDPDLNNINSTNSIKKNNSFIIRQTNELKNINNKIKKKTDISNISNIPINNYYNKISSKNKIPYKKNSSIIKQKNKLYSNNNKIRNKINSVNNSIFRSNSNYEKKEKKENDNIYNKNYYDLKINSNMGNIYKNKGSNKIIINTVYNSFTNNIYPVPHKINFTRYKKRIGYNNNMVYNYLENPFIIINHSKTNELNKKNDFLYDKKVINNFSNKSRDNSNILTDYELYNNNKTFNYSSKSIRSSNNKNIIIDKARNKNYIRNFPNNLLKLNPFITKNNKHKYIIMNNSSKNKYGVNNNKNYYSYRSSINLTKNPKI